MNDNGVITFLSTHFHPVGLGKYETQAAELALEPGVWPTQFAIHDQPSGNTIKFNFVMACLAAKENGFDSISYQQENGGRLVVVVVSPVVFGPFA